MAPAVPGKSLIKLLSFFFVLTSSWSPVTAVLSGEPAARGVATLPTENEGAHDGSRRHLLQDNATFFCYRNQVQCASGIAECFEGDLGCNGVNDCSDGSDESPSFCANYSCPIYKAKCPSSLCTTTYPFAPHQITSPLLCNGIKDCPDNSDEDPSFCAGYDCSSEGSIDCPGAKQCIQSFSRLAANTVGGFIDTDGYPTSICDGVMDCNDGSDESPATCSNYDCPNGSFKCGNLCLARFRVCDGHVDCEDGSDEDTSLCGASYNCSLAGYGPSGGFQHCPSGVGCYPAGTTRNCDGFVECLDGSDEDPAFCANYTCDPSLFIPCPSGVGCTETYYLCDGNYNCLDKSDERADVCANHTCSYGQVKCPSGNGGCLFSSDYVCDGKVENCLDGSDESDETCRTYDCGPDRTRCPSGVGCVTTQNLCDGIPGNGNSICKDGSDEDPTYCANHPQCPGYGSQIRCKNGTCITGELCDGTASCDDGSDEDPSYCQTASCPVYEQKCADGIHCVNQLSGLCDGHIDCPDGSDELASFCTTYQCPDYLTKCPGGTQCISNTTFCDGVADCNDGSDETDSFCASYTCLSNSFKCPGTNVCVYGALCNGYPDCPDHSDESQAICNPALPPTPESEPGAPPPTTANPPESPGAPPPTTASPPESPGAPPPANSEPGAPPPNTANPPESPGAPPPTISEPGAPPPVSESPPQLPGGPSPVTYCDPYSSLPNQCFNAQGTASICCPGQCPNTPGDAPVCGTPGPSPATCDPTSSTPNQCFNANGDQSVCCPGGCPGSPGPVAVCG